MTAVNIIKSLTKQGNAVLGAGCYAAALISKVDRNRVIKVGNNVNDPWLDYYEVIKANQHNPCVPRIYSFYLDNTNGYYVCIMERLYEEANFDRAKEVTDLCREYVQGWVTRGEFIDYSARFPSVILYPELLADLLEQIKALTDIMGTEVYDHGSDIDLGGMRKLDMHRGNFLYRDGAIVVTDPWCEADMSDITDVSDWWASRQEAC